MIDTDFSTRRFLFRVVQFFIINYVDNRSARVINEIKIRFFFTGNIPGMPSIHEQRSRTLSDYSLELLCASCYNLYIFFELHVSFTEILYILYLLGAHIATVCKLVINRSVIVGNKSILKIASPFSASKLFSNTYSYF